MKKYLPLLLFVLFLPVLSFGQEAFVIEHYFIDMEVRENNSYLITEILDVYFTESRRGIIREIPLYFDKAPVKISDVRVADREYRVTKDRDNLLIRIGSPDIYVEGPVRYILSYVYDVGADSLKDMDEFNHNLIGTGWGTSIKDAAFSVRLPKPFNPRDVNITSGPYGSTDNTGAEWKVEGTAINGRLIRSLGSNEGLTLALPLPEGYWVGAVRHRPEGWLLSLLTGYPLYALMVLFSFILWYRKGRDNPLFPTVEFRAPDGLNPAEIGYVLDGTADTKDITSLIIYWAQKGLLAIEEQKDKVGQTEGFVLIKAADPGPEFRHYERNMFKKLFELGKGGRVTMADLNTKFYLTIAATQKAVTDFFTKDPARAVYDARNNKYSYLTMLFAFIPAFLINAEIFSAFEGKGPLIFLGFFIALGFVVLFSVFCGNLALKAAGNKKTAAATGIASLLLTAALGSLAVFLSNLSPVRYLAAIAATFACGFFTAVMNKRTPYGDKITEKVLGFREFIDKAERDKLERLFDSDPAYFYNILPYAIVLGLSSKWSSHFESLALSPPTWYAGYRRDRFNVSEFESSLSRGLSGLSGAMSSAPASSSSGGGKSGSSSSGGFSGGGSGGGGGRSW